MDFISSINRELVWHCWEKEHGYKYCSLCGEKVYSALLFLGVCDSIPLHEKCLKEFYNEIASLIKKLEEDDNENNQKSK